ncbi:TIGR04282 family arsenosugar biosynthesis glycosyltransferase [Aquaticitalea lipolytica]|uniref:TIGR04282 family arsenosugar biosynthesis glycosyltransferase n=1 Tax=Aquaticitalea lipolytica TaxID=1247562 RepID=UPI0024BAFC35|nr:TIGR04282 family arsenosugar biosynthesis glycosyltransferase [Aquaticitalea lipolytica]
MAKDFHFPTSKKALIIFTRNPELGKCKTRLAATIGDESALEIYKYLLQHTAKLSEKVKADKYVFYSESIKREDVWNATIFNKKLQQGNDLGERMENAFTELFELGYEKVIIIGSDLLDLSSDDVNEAFDFLNENDTVIGPAKDGGYYLLGMKNMHSKVFKNKEWGTSTVLENTLSDLKDSTISMLKELNDIDTFEDMKHYEQLKKFYKNI